AMEMKRLNATGLRSAGYDERTRKLVVETTAGTFEYANVSPEVYRRLMASPSPASYYRESIEEEEYARRRVSDPSRPKADPNSLFD
ncbi:MAG TPA: KTSC domain-containing protein, partial [Usitatibacteraceae bacterium]|nr:KTSC domain-containing protein [Usitatibacteraceae bacterium]